VKFFFRTLDESFFSQTLDKKKRSGSDIMSEKSDSTVGKRQRKHTDADEDSLQTL
jgi:hypothetical protein